MFINHHRCLICLFHKLPGPQTYPLNSKLKRHCPTAPITIHSPIRVRVPAQFCGINNRANLTNIKTQTHQLRHINFNIMAQKMPVKRRDRLRYWKSRPLRGRSRRRVASAQHKQRARPTCEVKQTFTINQRPRLGLVGTAAEVGDGTLTSGWRRQRSDEIPSPCVARRSYTIPFLSSLRKLSRPPQRRGGLWRRARATALRLATAFRWVPLLPIGSTSCLIDRDALHLGLSFRRRPSPEFAGLFFYLSLLAFFFICWPSE
jgi:hypothetical protein